MPDILKNNSTNFVSHLLILGHHIVQAAQFVAKVKIKYHTVEAIHETAPRLLSPAIQASPH